jgi:predicted O-linked N-acetylglucosamine transferase (SPINDLY family)
VRIRTVFSRLSKWLDPWRGPDEHIARGRRAEEQGRIEEACRHYRAAIAADRGNAAAHLNLGIALEALGDAGAAMASYEAARIAEPGNPFASYNLGKAHHLRGDLGNAETMLRAALACKPDFPEAYVVLASVLEAQGNARAAVAALESALALRPGYEGALRNLGMLHLRLQRWDEAVTALERASVSNPANADVRFWLGNALARLEKSGEAAEHYRRALEIRPDHPESHCRLANILAELGQRDQAHAHLQRALALDPQLAEAQIGLGNLRAAEQKFEDAAALYRTAIGSEPGNVQAHVNLGNALVYLGEAEGARDAYDAALALDPECATARWARALCRIPVMRDADTDLARSRAELAHEFAQLDQWFDARRSASGHLVVGVQQPFWLAYQAENNVELLRAYGRLCARLMATWQEGAGLRARGARKPGLPRIGVVSQYFRRHSVWDAFVKGWFQGIDRRRFELHGFHLGSARDAQTQFAESRAARFVQGPKGLRQWVEAILEAQPDVLIYPEVGMDPMTVKLASLRLAPAQVASWGHPETTGLPTIDYYLSAQGMEAEGAQANYSERLVALPHLGCRLEPDEAQIAPVDPGRWGLPGDQPLLLCPGTPFKYAPEHDALYVEIVRRLGDCRLCFFICGIAELSERLRQRLARAFARQGLEFERHVSFLPWLPKAEFYGLMRRADVMLDTLGFSGFNTALQAMECGLPIVTCEGQYLRGRLASGMLDRLGLRELIAATEVDYVGLAVRLVRDPGYRDQLRRRIESGRHVLYRDAAPIHALEDFVQRAASA